MDRRKLLANSAAFDLAPVLPSRAIDALLASTSATGSGSSAVTDQVRDERNSLTPPERGSIPVAFPIAHGAEIIDFCGPWEVFRSADIPGGDAFQTYTVAETLQPITASEGMKIIPNYTFQTAPAPRVVVIPAVHPGLPPDFLHATLDRSVYAAFFTESRMRLVGSTNLHRKSGSVLGHSQPSLRDWSRWECIPRTDVLGYSQPSLRD
jgi:hypothetical protein